MAGFYGIDSNREVIRVHVKKCDGLMQPDVKKFSIDPQITSFEMLQNILAKAFDIKSDFTISYLSKDGSQEVYLSMLSDWDMDAAFQNASDPCLRLKVDLKPFDEVAHFSTFANRVDPVKIAPAGAVSSVSSGLATENAQGLEDWDIIAPVEIPQFRMAFLDKGTFLGNITGNISNHLSRTASQVQKVIGIKSEDNALYKPVKSPMNDAEFRNYLDSDGHMIKPEEFRLSIYQGGVEPSLRRVVWRHLLNIYPEDLSGRERFDYMKRKENEYFELRDNWKDLFTQRQVSDEAKHVASLVKKDVLRTDRTHKFYAGGDESKNLISLYNLLVTYALTHPEVSYCQGMSDIASPLLVVQKEEAQAYLCFCGLMSRLRSNFLYNGEAITTKLQHLSALVHFYDPEFHVYMKEHGAEDLFFCYRWLLLEMKREFPFEDALYMLEVMWSTLPPDPPTPGLTLKDPDYSPALLLALSPHSPTVALKQTQYSHLLAKRRSNVIPKKDIAGPMSPKVLVSPKFREALLKESAKGSGSDLPKIQEVSKESESSKVSDSTKSESKQSDPPSCEIKKSDSPSCESEKSDSPSSDSKISVPSSPESNIDDKDETKLESENEKDSGNEKDDDNDKTREGFDDVDSGCDVKHDWINQYDLKVSPNSESNKAQVKEDQYNSINSKKEEAKTSNDSKTEESKVPNDARSDNGRYSNDSRSEDGRFSRSEDGRYSRSEDGRYSRDSRVSSVKDDSPDKFESANTSMASSLSNSYSVERFPSLISGSVEDFIDDEDLEVISSSERVVESVDATPDVSEADEQFHMSLEKNESEALKKKSTIPQIKGSFFSGMKKILSSPIRRPGKVVKLNGNGNVVSDTDPAGARTVRSQSCNCLSSGMASAASAASNMKNRNSCYDVMGISPEGDSVEHTLFEVNLATSHHCEKHDRDSGNGSLTSSTNSSHMALTKPRGSSQNDEKSRLKLDIHKADAHIKDKNAKNKNNQVTGMKSQHMKSVMDKISDDRYPTFCENHFDIDNGDSNRTDEAKESNSISECMEVVDGPDDEVLRLKQLPAPELFGYGNPFLMFICLTVLLQHREMVLKASMEYDEIAMHFDKMVRKHNVHKVLHQARQLYTDYIQMQQSALNEGKTEPDFSV